MSNAVFPALAGIGWPIVKTPAWSTAVKRATSGFERRVQLNNSYPLYEFTLAVPFLGSNWPMAGGSPNVDLLTLQDFYNARGGDFDNFLFDDIYTPDDSVTDMQFGTGDGTTAAFQLQRHLPGGSFGEPVMNVNAMVNVKDNGSVIPPGAGAGKYTISATGLVTFGTVPAAGHALTWSGTYYYRCRFADGSLDFENFMNQLQEVKQLKLVGSLGVKV